jgi:sec-independent protein translocase protein TatA
MLGMGVGFAKLEKFMNTIFAAFLGGWEWVVVLLALLLLFGAKKIPELARGLGHGIKEFKKATREVTDEIQNTTTDTPPAVKPAAPAPSRADLPASQSSNPPKA